MQMAAAESRPQICREPPSDLQRAALGSAMHTGYWIQNACIQDNLTCYNLAQSVAGQSNVSPFNRLRLLSEQHQSPSTVSKVVFVRSKAM